MKHMLSTAAFAALFAVSGTAVAADSSYTPGTVWNFDMLKVADGQFENYMDYLDGNWKKVQEFGKQQGYVVSYHVYAVNNPRAGEPNVILGVEYKDYTPTAKRLEIQKKIEAMLATDERKMDTAFGDRQKMRKPKGSVEMQELNLK